uniref:G-protein coupled receptors family 3 profile domain-containing protein n=1 Tax=Odontella aurita TaxID=265563 RepID=A0A7S4IYQ5_9STRA|mmetsp:Transcript_33289/g.99089  ORF Transcript_33289/g.99089 Transcript_33289/m.99089 type:complete len:929 (+) Transcript_33289:206-2992(+)
MSALVAVGAALLVAGRGRVVSAALPCASDAECESAFRAGSTCDPSTSTCTNPLRSGCLRSYHPDWTRRRVCHSDDPPGAASEGECVPPDADLDYPEVRIHAQNWESSFFSTWALQILLSEVLGVPATVETGSPDATLDFYDGGNAFGYGTSKDFESLRRARDAPVAGDCRTVPRTAGGGPDGGVTSYQSCSHVIPEVWHGQLEDVRRDLLREGVVEPPQALGVLAQGLWFVPRFTGERDQTLLNYLGLRGEKNRRKVAEAFLRPTTWGDYCASVSPGGCATDDGVAARPPGDDGEKSRMFAEGLYTGHFRATDRNNCTKYPKTCTGHLADYPCGWTSFNLPLTHHLDIALENERYTYSQFLEMWAAANATKSNLIMPWWNPEALYQSYAGTDAEFQRVTLPPPSYQCYENRIDPGNRCLNVSLEERVGAPAGACEEAPQSLQKVVGKVLYDMTYDPSIPEARRSPGYEAVHLFQMSNLDLGRIFDSWLHRGVDKWGYDPRDAVCRYMAENFESIMDFIPRTYPRVVRVDNKEGWLFYMSLVLSILVTLPVAYAAFMTYRKRDAPAIKYAQYEFLWLLLVGLLLLALGALVIAIPPVDASCVLEIWLINLGYMFELVPLIVKVAATNRLMNASRRMRRVVLPRSTLFGAVAFLGLGVTVYLITWTVADRPTKGAEFALTDAVTEDGDTVVSVNYVCGSQSEFWWYVSIACNVLLLISATVLAIQTRKQVSTFNESQTLGFMVYSHFIFVLTRMTTLFLDNKLSGSDLARARSLVYSCDAMATIFVYFFPKFFGTRPRFSGRFSNFLASGSGGSLDRHASFFAASAAGNRRYGQSILLRGEQLAVTNQTTDEPAPPTPTPGLSAATAEQTGTIAPIAEKSETELNSTHSSRGETDKGEDTQCALNEDVSDEENKPCKTKDEEDEFREHEE